MYRHLSVNKTQQGSAALGAALQLFPNPQGFRAVVHQRFFKPRVLQSLLGRDPGLRVVDEDTLQEIQEQLVELVICGYKLLPMSVSSPRQKVCKTHVQLFHCPHVFPRGPSRLLIWVVKFISDKISDWSVGS